MLSPELEILVSMLWGGFMGILICMMLGIIEPPDATD